MQHAVGVCSDVVGVCVNVVGVCGNVTRTRGSDGMAVGVALKGLKESLKNSLKALMEISSECQRSSKEKHQKGVSKEQ